MSIQDSLRGAASRWWTSRQGQRRNLPQLSGPEGPVVAGSEGPAADGGAAFDL